MKKFILSVLILFTAAACQQKQEQGAAPPFPQGQIRGQEEIRMLREAVGKDPKNVAAWIQLGNVQMDTNRFDEAIVSYQKALDLDPKNADVRVDMGVCYRNTGRPDIAIIEFRRAIEANPSHVMAHKNLAIVLEYDKNDKQGAIKEFEKALQLAPQAPDAARIKQEIEALKQAKG